MHIQKNNVQKLTNKPRIPSIILDIQPQEVLFKSRHIIRLWLDADGAFYGALITLGDQGPGAPAVGTDPAEEAGRVSSFYRAHHAGHFLV